jgi:hypothetical protein
MQPRLLEDTKKQSHFSMNAAPTQVEKVYFMMRELARRAHEDFDWRCKDAAKHGYPAPAEEVEFADMLAATKLSLAALDALVRDEVYAPEKEATIRAVNAHAVKVCLLPFLQHEYELHLRSAKKAGRRASPPSSLFAVMFRWSLLTAADFT